MSSLSLRICIPTLNRRDKLQVCLNSIFQGAKTDKVKVSIYFGDKEELEFFQEQLMNIPTVDCNYLESYRVPDFWNARLLELKEDALLYINDDVEFYEDTLEVILEDFKRRFPDTDGVMGLNQVNIKDPNKVQSAFGVIGTKYANRFPDRQVWAPFYDRFYCDWEVWKYAVDIKRFFYNEWARINHYHPCTNRALEDATHNKVRTYLKSDKQTFQRRQASNLLWGHSFQ